MRRAVVLALAALALAAAGCGDSPEDQARSAGEQIGGDLYAVQNAKSAGDARQALGDIRSQLKDVGGELPAGLRDRLSAIADDLQASLRSAQDSAARRAAFLDALSQLDAVASDTDSVVNEFRRGVRQGYQDAAG
jgi:ABC-type transporter Mla subunit MlaD